MKNWLVLHDMSAFSTHPDYIGKEERQEGKISKIKKGDNVIYYCTGDMIITGIYKVVSDLQHWKKDPFWEGGHVVYKIKPIIEAHGPQYIGLNNMLKEISLNAFPKGKVEGIKLKGRTAIPISKHDLKAIEMYIKNYKGKSEKLFAGVSNDEGLGEPMELEVMGYAPTSEAGVIVLFAHFLKKLGFERIEFIRAGFPDACVLKKVGEKFERKYIEFEFQSSSFRIHIKNPKHKNIKCDYIVCWENDFINCPVPVIELKTELQKLRILK